jgi:protein CpxP
MSTFKTLAKTTLTPIALCLTLTLTVVAPAMAQKGHHQQHDGMRQILSELSLTVSQKQDIRQVLKQTREDRYLFSTDVKSIKTELRGLVQSSEWDPAAVEDAIRQLQTFIQEKAQQQASNKSQIWNLLTVTQQAELTVLYNRLKAKREKMRDNGKRKGKKLRRIELTETQITAAEVIKNAAKASGKKIEAKLKTYKQVERALVHSTHFNTEAWQTLNHKYQDDFLAMAVLRAKTKHNIWHKLTPEQQAKAGEK